MAKKREKEEVQSVSSGLISVKAKRWDGHRVLGSIKLPAAVAEIAGKKTLAWQDAALILDAGLSDQLNRKYFDVTEV